MQEGRVFQQGKSTRTCSAPSLFHPNGFGLPSGFWQSLSWAPLVPPDS